MVHFVRHPYFRRRTARRAQRRVSRRTSRRPVRVRIVRRRRNVISRHMLPATKRVTFKTVSNSYTLDPIAGGFTTTMINLSDLNDPFIALGSTVSNDLEFWKQAYRQYEVMRTRVSIQVLNADNSHAAIIWTFPSGSPALPFTDPLQVMESNKTQRKILLAQNGSDRNFGVLTRTLTPSNELGLNVGDDGLKGVLNNLAGAPLNPLYLYIGAQPFVKTDDLNNVIFRITLWQECLLSDRVILNEPAN